MESVLPCRDVDTLARHYMSIGARIGTVPAVSLTRFEGQVCALCGGGPMTRRGYGPSVKTRRKYRDVCATCGESWLGEELHLPPQRGRRGGVGSRDVMLDDWKRIRPIVENRPRRTDQNRWDFCVVSLLAFLEPTIGTYARAADAGRRRMPHEYWSPARVRGAVQDARFVLQGRAERARVLVERAPRVRAAA